MLDDEDEPRLGGNLPADVLNALKPQTEPEDTHPLLSDEATDPSVMAYQDPDEPVRIKCICDTLGDRRFIIPCLQCGDWQHVACYYDKHQSERYSQESPELHCVSSISE